MTVKMPPVKFERTVSGRRWIAVAGAVQAYPYRTRLGAWLGVRRLWKLRSAG